jgi:nucleoporin SEH1
MVEASAYNSYGTRFALGSADGKIKVFDRLRNGTFSLCDTWAAHNAEILELHWLPPTIHPNLLASISTDGRFRLWAEDATVPPLSGRRFNGNGARAVFELRAPPRTPFYSFDVKHNPETRATYLALLDKAALLTVYENDEPENMSSWNQIDAFLVCEKPARGEEVSFRVRFDPNLEPCYNAIREGVPRDSLGLIVAGMGTARVWRSKVVTHDVSLGSGSTREFYRAVDLPDHKALVRDVAWASGSIRGFDIMATACKDGLIRVWEVRTPGEGDHEEDGRHIGGYGDYPAGTKSAAQRGNPSGIGAGLATVRSGVNGRSGADMQPGQVRHEVKEVSRLDGHHGPVWRCEFDDDGQMLGTTGDDGRLLLWRRQPSGEWALNGELALKRS